jgi:hypothetical protein
MEMAKLADLAEAVFGPDRVHSAPRLDQAIEEAVTLADEAEAAGGGSDGLLPGATGVLIVGSVITAGDARTLLLPGQAEDPGLPAAQLPPAGPPEPGTADPAEPESAEPESADPDMP